MRVPTSFASTSPTAPATSTRRTSRWRGRRPRPPGERSACSATCPGPKLRIDEVEGGVVDLREGSELTLTTGEGIGAADHLPVSWDGLPAAVHEGDEVFLADGRVRLRVLAATADEVRCAVEVGGAVASHQGLNMPGTEVPLPSAGRVDLDWVDFAVEHGIDLLAVSFVRRAEDLQPVERRVRVAGADIPLIAKIEKPQAAENAEAIIARGGRAGSWSPAATSGSSCRSSGCRPSRSGCWRSPASDSQAVDHRDPDAGLDGLLAATDPGRGHGRRERDLPGHRRRDALRGDGGRRVSGRGGAGDGPDRARDRARPPLRRLGVQPGRHGAATSPARSPGRRSGRPTRSGWPRSVVPTRSGRTARLVSAHRPAGAGARGLAADRDGAAAEPPVRRPDAPSPTEWTSLRTPARRLRAARRARPASPQPGDLIGITAGLPEQELGTNLFEVHRVP